MPAKPRRARRKSCGDAAAPMGEVGFAWDGPMPSVPNMAPRKSAESAQARTMLKLGIMADVHANLPPLEAILDVLRRSELDRCLCADDLLGDGPLPNERTDALRASGGLRSRKPRSDRRSGTCRSRHHPLARRSVEWTTASLTGVNRRYLAQLHHTALRKGCRPGGRGPG